MLALLLLSALQPLLAELVEEPLRYALGGVGPATAAGLVVYDADWVRAPAVMVVPAAGGARGGGGGGGAGGEGGERLVRAG
eukprot:COSAG01_NODE_12113_length_1799_cov_1.134118_1_plen_80_part_10